MGKGWRIGAMIGVIGAAYGAWAAYKDASARQYVPVKLVEGLTGYDYLNGTFDWTKARIGIPLVAGCGVSMIASKVGLNRYTPKGINI